MIFKKMSLLAVAAMFMASALFIGCGDNNGNKPPVNPPTPPSGGAEVVFDNFEMRPDSDGIPGFTTQNMLPNGGAWYSYGCTGDLVTTHEGVSLLSDMYPALGDGNLNIVIDVENGTDYKCATVVCQLFDNGSEGDNTKHSAADLRSLKSIKIKGGLQGTMFVGFISKKISSSAAGPYGWSVGRPWGAAMTPLGSSEGAFLELNVSQMIDRHWSTPHPVGKDDYLSEVTALIITVDTEEDVKIIASIDEIVLVFNDESSIPVSLK